MFDQSIDPVFKTNVYSVQSSDIWSECLQWTDDTFPVLLNERDSSAAFIYQSDFVFPFRPFLFALSRVIFSGSASISVIGINAAPLAILALTVL